MIKKTLYIFTFLFIFIFLAGCSIKLGNYSINNFMVTKKKPNNYYYINNLAKNLALENSMEVKLFDINFSKEKELSQEDKETIKNFVKALRKPNYIDKPTELPEKPTYKLFFTFSKEKYVINVYNERYLSVYPWDGSYPMDYIDMEGIKNLYNIYWLCKYLIPR